MAGKALAHQMTRAVRVNREKLVATLISNKEKHVREYGEAMAGYKEVALAKLEEAYAKTNSCMAKWKKELVDKIHTFSPETAEDFGNTLVLVHQIAVNMPVPKSYADAYDAAIDMFQFETREEVDLSGAEFQCFCRDVWDWSYEFEATAANYTNSGRR
jgi:hypothetical protein